MAKTLSAAGLVCALVVPAAAFAQQSLPASRVQERPWLGPDGEPLPFRSDAEVLEFLRTARVVERERIETGITRPWRLVLEKDGVRARAIFRDVDVERRDVSVEGRFYLRFRDSYGFECAAYALAQRLGFDNVPPVVGRRLWKSGSVQLWVERTRDETAADFKPPDAGAWVRQIWDKDLFDNLILNVDRNSGNILVDQDYRLWLIDHTRAFQAQVELLDAGRLRRVSRTAWARLLEMDEAELGDLVRPFLDVAQVGALAGRRELLIERVRTLVEERGEEVVFY